MKTLAFTSLSKATDLLGGSGKKKQACSQELAPTLSDDLWDVAISYCDVVHLPTFVALRYVNRTFMESAEHLVEPNIFDTSNAEEARKGSSAALEFECRGFVDYPEGDRCLTFRLGWSDEYHPREALIEKALQYCDPRVESQRGWGKYVSISVDFVGFYVTAHDRKLRKVPREFFKL
jgi:hypothetical protein